MPHCVICPLFSHTIGRKLESGSPFPFLKSTFYSAFGMQISTSWAAIIAAVCAGVGALLGAMVTAVYNQRLDKHKRRREERDAVSKFRGVLLRSSEQLQSHVLQLCYGHVPPRVRHLSLTAPDSYAYCILIYRIGQLLCWMFLLENDIQTIHYTPTADDHRIMDILYAIHRGLGDSRLLNGAETPLRIFRGIQDSIGELMSAGDSEKGTQRCMGYPEFWKRWTVAEDNEFRPWFSQLEEGLRGLLHSQSGDHQLQGEWFFRVMQFQHLLIELVDALDPKNDRVYTRPRTPFARIETPFLAESCTCTHCEKLRRSRPTLSGSTHSQPAPSAGAVGDLRPPIHEHKRRRTKSRHAPVVDIQSTRHTHSLWPWKTTSQRHVGNLAPPAHTYNP